VSKSRYLRLRDLREAFRLVGECRDLGDDPEVWRRHAFRQIVRLIGGRAAVGAEIRWRPPEGPLVLFQSVDEGLSRADRAVFLEYMRVHGPRNDPITGNLKRLEGRLGTRRLAVRATAGSLPAIARPASEEWLRSDRPKPPRTDQLASVSRTEARNVYRTLPPQPERRGVRRDRDSRPAATSSVTNSRSECDSGFDRHGRTPGMQGAHPAEVHGTLRR
jgi:hypothetical protein